MKALSAVIAALSLAFAGAVAAAPVSVSFSNNSIMSNGVDAASFTDSYNFTLAVQTLLSGNVATHTPGAGGAWVNITSAYLQAQSGGPTYALTETTAVDWDADQFGVEVWTFSPQQLAAGNWVLHVVGEGYNDKMPEGYTAHLEGRAGDLPEPAGIALVAMAMSALALTRRRAR